MKKISLFISIFVLCFPLFASAEGLTGGRPETTSTVMSKEKWEAFNQSLVRALGSDHKGLQQAAMRLAIQYAGQADISEAVFDVVKIYRNSNDENMRRMAVITMGKMQNKWAIKFLERSEGFEKSPVVKKQIRLVLAEHQAQKVVS